MAVDVGYLSAAGAGAISFLSPCMLPPVPPYVCYMAGMTVDDFPRAVKKRRGPERGLGRSFS
jgi:cytochrome c-type biogenesis protein